VKGERLGSAGRMGSKEEGKRTIARGRTRHWAWGAQGARSKEKNSAPLRRCERKKRYALQFRTNLDQYDEQCPSVATSEPGTGEHLNT